ncbi:MAG: TRAP transporter small permease [Candidatus Rokuibacteriota bacterium]
MVNGLLVRIDRAIEALSALLMGALALLVFLGVVYRYVLVAPIAWIEEIVRLCLVWVTFLGAYLAMRRGQHIAMDVVYERLGRRGRRVADAVGTLLLALFFLVLAWYGTAYAQAFMGARSPFLGFPQGVTYFALPAGAVLLLLALAPAARRLVRPADAGETPPP